MNKFEIHLLLAAFTSEQQQQLEQILSPLSINIHTCDIAADIASLPKVHVMLIGQHVAVKQDDLAGELDSESAAVETYDIGPDAEPAQDETVAEADSTAAIIDQFIIDVKKESTYCLTYLLSSRDAVRQLNEQQRLQFRDFIEFPITENILEHRLLRIVNDLQDKFIQLVKKRRLKQQLLQKEQESQQLKENLHKSIVGIREANKQLIRMLSNQVFARMGQRASGRNQELNLLLEEMASLCNFSEQQTQDLTEAWHLRNIGKLSFSDEMINTPYIKLNVTQQRTFNCHPTLSHAAMMIVRPLDRAAKIVLQHKEYLDGSGYPNRLKAEDISIEAQLLSVVNDYTELVAGRYSDQPFSTVEAITYLDNYASEKYNDEFVIQLGKLLPKLSKAGRGMHDLRVSSNALKLGMQLSRDLISQDGLLLLSVGLIFDRASISRVQEMEMNLQEQFEIFIKKK